MSPSLVGPMSQLFSSYNMHSNYQYPNLSEAKAIKPTTAPYLTPYLGPRSRLSQVWFNRWTLLLSLIVVRVYLSTESLDSDIDSAHREAISACTSVERAGSAMASMPHYMAAGVNELTAKSIEGAVRGLHQLLLMSITGVQEIVVFVINMLVSTYVCLITFAVAGALGVVLDATEKIAEFLNNTIGAIANELGDGVGKFEKQLNDLAEKIGGSIGNLFGGNFDMPDLNLDGPINKLKDIKIPSTFDDKLQEIRDKIPDFKEVKEAGNNAIRVPFQALQQQINSTLNIYKFDRSVFPIPQKEKLTFCSTNNDISDFFSKLKSMVRKTKNIVIGVLIAMAVTVMGPMAYLELRKWRVTRQRAYMFGSNPNYDPVDVSYLASRPSTGTLGMRLANWAKSERRQVLIRWVVAYATSTPALFVLSLAVAGIISAVAQMIILKQVEKAVPELAEQVGGFAGDVVDLLNNASVKFATGTNMVITNVTDELNKEIFGWLTEGTDSLNDTLNTFTKTMSDGIDKVFGGTPLEKPVEEVINCLIGLKIEALQKGLTWIHENAKISFPPIPNDTFSLGALNSLDDSGSGKDSFLADPEGASADMITDTLLKMSNRWHDGLSTEATISAGVLGVWGIVILIALIRTACLWWKKDNVRGDGGGRGTNFSTTMRTVFPSGGSVNMQRSASNEGDGNGSEKIEYPEKTKSKFFGLKEFHLGRGSSSKSAADPESLASPDGWINEKKTEREFL